MYTRCTYCDTWLHISAEQLRSGMGQVQCGSCGEVFNALPHLAEVSPVAPQLEPVSTAYLPPELRASADSAAPAPQSSATADPGSILADVALKPQLRSITNFCHAPDIVHPRNLQQLVRIALCSPGACALCRKLELPWAKGPPEPLPPLACCLHKHMNYNAKPPPPRGPHVL